MTATAKTTAQSLTVGRAMPSFTPLSASGGTLPYTYNYTGILPAGLSFSASTGAVTGTPTATYPTAGLTFSVRDANSVAAQTTSTVLFTVGAASPNITAIATTTAQNLTAGTPMASFSPLTASGGAWPYTFSYTGTLPSGLSFDTATGAVTGTPAVASATASLVFSVKDANGVAAITTSTVSFTVASASFAAATDLDAFNAGYAAYVAMDYAGAASKFDAMILAYPASTLLDTAYFYLGKSLYHLSDFSGAIAKFDIVLNTYPSSAFADDALLWKGKSIQSQARVQFAAGNLAGASTLFVAARTAYQSVISNYPGTTLTPDCNYQIALTYYDEKNYTTAVTLFMAVLANYPTSTIADGTQYYLARSIHALALAATPTYTFALARTEYAKVITSYPASIWVDNAQYQIGKSYYDELNYVTAITEFDKVFANYPTSTIADAALYYKGRSIQALALPVNATYTLVQARAEFSKLITNYPSSIFADNAQYQIGKTYFDELNYAAAIVEFNAALTNYPFSTFADGAQYYKARSIHALAISTPLAYSFQQARDEYAKVKANYPTSIYVDNAEYHSAYTYHDSTQCTSELAAMLAFVTAYPASFYAPLAQNHINDLTLATPLTHTICI